jgi:protein O-mannosyl-transferase
MPRKRRNLSPRAVSPRRETLASQNAPAAQPGKRLHIALALVLILLAALAAYSNSFQGVFFYDDASAIADNTTIYNLSDWRAVLAPPNHGEPVSGRPLLNVSFALNYALGGTRVLGYHVVNVAIHILNAFLLFGIVRRTLLGIRDWGLWIREGGRWKAEGGGVDVQASCHLVTLSPCHPLAAIWLAAAIALVWALHPLQTEAVTYISQRAESLGAFFYLLTLYCVIRGAESSLSRPDLWYTAAVLACLLGMAAKEIMVTAPLVVLLYDRTFMAGSFAAAVRRRGWLYLALAATWGLLAYLVASAGLLGRAATVATAKTLTYAAHQPGVILYYLRLCFWPHPLTIHYAWPGEPTVAEVLIPAIPLAVLTLVTLGGLWRRSWWGLLGAWIFLILAPTSSIIVLQQVAFEHRMYLPLAAVVTLVVVGGYVACRAVGHGAVVIAAILVTAACIVLGVATYERNSIYHSVASIWQDVVDHNLNDAEAYNNLGAALAKEGKIDEANKCYRRSLEIEPNYAWALANLGDNLCQKWQLDESLCYCQKAVESDPTYPMAHWALGNVLFRKGKIAEAEKCYRQALALNPRYADAYSNLGCALETQGKLAEALANFQAALELNPHQPDTHENLGRICYRQAKVAEAYMHWREVLAARPKHASILVQMALSLATNPDASLRNGAEAVRLANHAVQVTGGREPLAYDALAAAYAETGQFNEAVRAAQQALELSPAANSQQLEVRRQRIRLFQAGQPLRAR